MRGAWHLREVERIDSATDSVIESTIVQASGDEHEDRPETADQDGSETLRRCGVAL